tara:strand:+ start:1070 stop:1525 length:456 start_codon:yes stop_codon:yes gene_type:complete
MIKLKNLINDWNDKSFENAPKRWSSKYGESLTEFEKMGGKDIVTEGKNEYASIYNMKEEMKEGKFDPKNPSINVHGLGVYSLKLLEKAIKRDLVSAANDLGFESGAKNLNYHLYGKHKPLQSKIKGLWEVYQQMNTSQYKRAVTMYKRKKR